jgi:hypothetical protein
MSRCRGRIIAVVIAAEASGVFYSISTTLKGAVANRRRDSGAKQNASSIA